MEVYELYNLFCILKDTLGSLDLTSGYVLSNLTINVRRNSDIEAWLDSIEATLQNVRLFFLLWVFIICFLISVEIFGTSRFKASILKRWYVFVIISIFQTYLVMKIGFALDYSVSIPFEYRYFRTVLFNLVPSIFSIRIDRISTFFLFFIPYLTVAKVVYLFTRRDKETFTLNHLIHVYAFGFLACLAFSAGHDLLNLFTGAELMTAYFFFYLYSFGSLQRRDYAAYFYLMVSAVSAAFFIVGMIMFSLKTGTLNLEDLVSQNLSGFEVQIFERALRISSLTTPGFFIFIAIAIKIPVYPFYNWLPEVHAEANTTGSVDLASIILKYSFFMYLRIFFPVLDVIEIFSLNGVTLALLSFVLYGVYLCGFRIMKEFDIKRFIALTSIMHMGLLFFCLVFIRTPNTLKGVLIGLVAHSLMVSMLFFFAGSIYSRFGTRNILHYRMLIARDELGSLFFVCLLANAGYPITILFISEVYLLSETISIALDLLLSVLIVLLLGSSAVFVFIHFLFLSEKWDDLREITSQEDMYKLDDRKKDRADKSWETSAGEYFIGFYFIIMLFLLLVLINTAI